MYSNSDVPVLGRDTQANKTNWVTTSFMVAFHVLAVNTGALLTGLLKSYSPSIFKCRRAVSMVLGV